MKKRAILIVGLALAIATAGLVYAHWTETLTTDVQVMTGNVNPQWNGSWTDDDGGTGLEEPATLSDPIYSGFYPEGNRDPKQAGYPDYADSDAKRYDKDVAQCASWTPGAGVAGAQANAMNVVLYNAYPSYHCTVWNNLVNIGSVPIKVQAMKFYVTRAGVALPLCTGSFPCVGASGGTLTIFGDSLSDAEMTMEALAGPVCGTQVDPGDPQLPFISTFHVLNGAIQGDNGSTVTYTLQGSMEFRNWNESTFLVEDFNLLNCTTFSLVPLF